MKKIPCRLCPACGKYSSLNISRCRCGADLSALDATAVEYNAIPLPKLGRIDKDVPFYVRKCPVCSTEHFFTDPGGAVRVCRNCHKSQIGYQPTLPYGQEEEEKKPAPGKEPAIPVSPVVTGGWGAEDEEDEDEDDVPTGSFYDQIRKNVQAATGAAATPPKSPAAQVPADPDDEDDDEDEDPPGGIWGQLLGKTGGTPAAPGTSRTAATPGSSSAAAPRQPEKPAVSTLTATAIRYGHLTFTLRSDSRELPYLLGRYANHGEFFRQDPRVGSEHCWIDFRNGKWMVLEKRAINGTAVNGNFLDEGGSQILRHGDELTLGHHADSMALHITIQP